jgi:hypothetical protein
MRATTLRDARKLALAPSVTNILYVYPKPGLDAYKQTQAILSALTLPRNEGEGDDDFARRVVEDAQAHGKDAADLGSRIHDGINHWLTYKTFPPEDVLPYCKPVIKWLAEREINVLFAEQTVGSNRGYAGTLDLKGGLVGHGLSVVDFKTQKFPKNGKPNWYKDWPLQLAAYAQAAAVPGESEPRLLSVAIDTDQPGRFEIKDWGRDIDRRYWYQFLNCFHTWKYDNDYDPAQALNIPSHVPA